MKSKPSKTLLAAFCLSASIIVPAQANDIILFPDIPADQIARDSVRSYDSSTGASIAIAPTFDPFEQDNTLAGTAALRSGPSEIAIDGTQVAGGAYLDLKMIYTSASDDPYDLRGYERAYYVSGDEVSRINQDVRTLDCASNTAEVVYEDNYYNSYETYGYLAGVYLLLPRYRGHRGFWNGGSRYRPSASWSDWRRRGSYNSYGNYGASYGGGRFAGSNDRNRGSGSRGSRGSGTAGHTASNRGGGRRGSGDRDRDRDRDRETGNGERGATTNTARTQRHNGRDAVIGGSATSREYRRRRGVVAGGPLQRSSENQAEQGNNNERNTGRSSENRNTRAHRSTRTDRAGRTDRGRGRTPAAGNTSQPVTNGRANPAGAPPRTIARSAPPATVNSNRETRTAPTTQRQSPQRSNSRPRSSRNLNREVDRSFSRANRSSRSRKQMEFFPRLGGYTQVSSSIVTNYRCVREESVTLHIPQERLDAARFDGMTLVVVDNADRDVPIYLPPNYIEGFRQAAGRSSYIAPSPGVVSPPAAYQSPDYNTQRPNAPIYNEPTYQGGYPQN